LEYAHFLRPDFPKLSLARAVVRLELGQPGEAWAALETAYKQAPDNKEVLELRTKLMAVQGKLADAPD
jgi:predicted Zn-dependent protease